ncbi:MAG: helix-turn-helix domain-containing protein [Thermoleophilaceae bacterium]
MTVVDDRPWEALPPDVAAVMRPELPALADEIVAAVSAGVPDYARPMEGSFGRGLRIGVEEALRQFLALAERPGSERGPGRDVYVNLGRGEMRAGRSLDALQAAYRLGARVAWRRLRLAGERAGLAPDTMYALAEAIFAYIDELSAESIEGYAREQAAAAGEQQRRRRRLAALLVQDPPADRAAVEALAAEVAWPLPESLAGVAVEGSDADRLAARGAADWLAAPAAGLVCLLVPDPEAPGRRAELLAVAGDAPLAIGPAVAWHEAALSFGRAQSALRLAVEGVIDTGRPVVADDHAVELLLHADRRLARDLAARALAPLADLTPASRERMSATLMAWLAHQGRTEAVARALHVHPQTVRYRMGRLRDLLGEALKRPDSRFELELALRAGRLPGPAS